jgi:hypothetical protein
VVELVVLFVVGVFDFSVFVELSAFQLVLTTDVLIPLHLYYLIADHIRFQKLTFVFKLLFKLLHFEQSFGRALLLFQNFFKVDR